ncbi:hypothetical protein [Chryseobacterium contaminans]|uniref:hypothetical protein n=1 Tax=Chryseobacterium contaminans TaxID=1423959 RepID=UPI003016E65A
MRNKIKYIAILLLNLNLIMISCQSKSEKVDLNIVQESYVNLANGKQANQLRYRDYIDDLHSRIVLQGKQIQEKWQPFKNNGKLDYMDVYFNKEKIIGFKGYFADSKNNSDEIYKDILKKISSDKEYQEIELKNEDSNIVRNEWESKEMIVGVKYEKVNKSIALIAVNKNELPYFFDKIFYSEFLDLTKFRNKNSAIHLKELQVQPSSNDKSFYKDKFNELKGEYNKKTK